MVILIIHQANEKSVHCECTLMYSVPTIKLTKKLRVNKQGVLQKFAITKTAGNLLHLQNKELKSYGSKFWVPHDHDHLKRRIQ